MYETFIYFFWNFFNYIQVMKFLIGHSSALEYWKLHDRGIDQGMSRAKHYFVKPSLATASLFENAEVSQLERPVHFVASHLETKPETLAYVCHGSKRSFTEKSALRIGKNLYVSTPEECFLQLASSFSLIQLIQAGFELCGSYAIRDNRLLVREPRMTVLSLNAYLTRIDTCYGIHKARIAAQHLLDDSASPMETALSMLLCLPTSMGGYGLPKPHLNYPIAQEGKLYRCDLCWPDKNLALEYDSDQYHSSFEKLHADSTRRIQIEASRIHVISVSKRQLFDVGAFNQLARAIAPYLGKRLRIRVRDFPAKRDQLRSGILFDHKL